MFELLDVSPQSRWRQLAAPVAWLIITAVGIYLSPDASGHGTHRQLGLPACPSVVFWGRPCPACGLTTSWTHLLHGHFWASLVSNALGPILYLCFTAYAIGHFVAYLKHKQWDTNTKVFNWAVSSVLVVFLIYGGIRWATTRYPGPAVADAWIHANRR